MNSKPSRPTITLLLVLMALLLQACSNNDHAVIKSRHQAAPQTPAETGWLVEIKADADHPESKIADYLRAHDKVKVRHIILNVYEFFNTSEKELKENLPVKEIYKNDVFSTQLSNQNNKPILPHQLINSLDDTNESEGTRLICNDYQELKAEEMVEQGTLDAFNFKTLTLGQNVSFDLKPLDKGSWKPQFLAWLVEAPQGSMQSGLASRSTHMELTPDMTGSFVVTFFVQGSDLICRQTKLKFSITSNEPYHGPESRTEDKLSQRLEQLHDFFPHLKSIGVDEAWKLSTGEGIKIAVIDSGVNYNHPQLASQIEVNSKEIPNNGIDDDENNIVDDYIGYDFANSDEFPFDDDGHGSHVAGLIAGKDFGVAKNAKIIPIKALGTFSGDSGSLYGALVYAIIRKADIINLSLGTYGKLHPLIEKVLKFAEQQNILIVVAAGNGDPETGLGLNIDSKPIYPAAYTEGNILSVAAFSTDEVITSYSNFGKTSVDVLAPGGNQEFPMLSSYVKTATGQEYQALQGTSMATPVVTGMAALIMTYRKTHDYQLVINSIMQTGEKFDEVEDFVRSGRHVNAYQALLFDSPQ